MSDNPESLSTVTAVLISHDAAAMLDFYSNVLGGEELSRMERPDNGKIMWSTMRIGDSIIAMYDESPEQGCASAKTIGDSPVKFYVYVDDVDASAAKAKAAGMEETMPLEDMFWGDRVGVFKDPFGFSWTLAQHMRDVSPEEMESAMKGMAA